MNVSFVRALGVIAIAHGLSHAVLPLRGSFEPAWLIRDYAPILLYLVATTGFLIAGVGLLGVRLVTPFISPLLVLSSALSSVAIFRVGDSDLAGGMSLDAALLLLGLWRGYAGWPQQDAVNDPVAHRRPVPTR